MKRAREAIAAVVYIFLFFLVLRPTAGLALILGLLVLLDLVLLWFFDGSQSSSRVSVSAPSDGTAARRSASTSQRG